MALNAMESELTCAVCSEIYSRGLREPILLPNCGHTFCRMCLRNVESLGSLECPSCRTPHSGSSVSQLPTIFALLNLSESFQKPQIESICVHHGSTLEFWCRNCQEGLCGHCLLAGHILDRHIVEKGTHFVAEKKIEILNSGSELVQDISLKKETVIGKVIELIKQMAVNAEESKILHNSKLEVEALLKDVPKITGIESALTTSVIVESLHSRTQRISADNSSNNCTVHNKCTSCTKAANSNYHFPRQRHESLSLEEITDVSGLDVGSEKRMNPQHMIKAYHRLSSYSEASPECSDNQKASLEGALGNKGHHADSLRCSPTQALRTKAPWPLQCCVISSDGRKGRLIWENEKLHMYCLSRESCDTQFMIQLSVVEWLISAQSPEVFLDLGSQYHHLGRVYIKLFGYLHRAQHFLALCLGSLGPSYKQSKFHGVAKAGAPGETIAGGKYITNDNAISVQGLIPKLEWGGPYVREKKAGLVVGATGRSAPDEAFFHICTRDQVGKKYGCAFGEVVAGMPVLHEAVQHLLAEYDVVITEAGVVLSPDTSP
ncbi:hypothetical protein SK128_001956 [Halocaridina rubra]|uniref:RING-type E3 ubiquitin transferase n=1 Tax=Halocaridina rubra TaxID=373956 RepID=A0AAN8WV36_HALRR